jgi:hypothetical protein
MPSPPSVHLDLQQADRIALAHELGEGLRRKDVFAHRRLQRIVRLDSLG